MAEKLRPGESLFKPYTFTWVHPKNDCPNGGRTPIIQTRTINAISKSNARAIAENTPVICGGCHRDYHLKG